MKNMHAFLKKRIPNCEKIGLVIVHFFKVTLHEVSPMKVKSFRRCFLFAIHTPMVSLHNPRIDNQGVTYEVTEVREA